MYNPKKLSFEQRLTKKSIAYGTLISICIMILTGALPAQAFTNQFVSIASSSCSACGNPFTVSDTATNTNDLLVFAMSCTTAFTITGITDTATNVWSNTGTLQQYGITNSKINSGHTGTTTITTSVWFAQAKSTAASTASITTSAASSNCLYQTFDGNTIFSAYASDFITSVNYNTFASTQSPSLTTTQSFATNTITLILGEKFWERGSQTACPGTDTAFPPTQFINCTSEQSLPMSDGACSGAGGCVLGTNWGNFQTLSSVTSGIGYQFQTAGNAGGTSLGSAIIILGYNFNISGTIQSSGTTQSQNLCSSTFTPTSASTKTGNIVSNVTYWSPIYNAIGIGSGNYIYVTNITLWVSSITIAPQTAVDIYLLMWLPGGAFSPNNQPALPTPTAPWFPSFNYPSQTGVAQQGGKVLLISSQHFTTAVNPFKISTPLAITSVAAGMSFAIGFYTTHNGVNLVKCTGSYPQLYQQTVPNSVIVNSGFDVTFGGGSLLGTGPLNTANQNGTTPYLYALINNPGTTTLQTVTTTIFTVTSFSTITSTSTTGVATTTITTTTTVITNAFASATGGALIEQNLITYMPLWALPLIFGALGAGFGFGLGGLLYGLMIALVIGQLSGLIPIWTVFIDVIMIYLLLRR